MESNWGGSALPGLTPKVENESRVFLKDDSHKQVVGIRIDEDTQDVDNTTVTKLRPGLVLVRVEAGDNAGKFVHVDHADAPEAADIMEAVLLMGYHNMLSQQGVVEDQVAQGLIHGVVDEAQVVWGTDDEAVIDRVKEVMTLVHFWPELA